MNDILKRDQKLQNILTAALTKNEINIYKYRFASRLITLASDALMNNKSKIKLESIGKEYLYKEHDDAGVDQ